MRLPEGMEGSRFGFGSLQPRASRVCFRLLIDQFRELWATLVIIWCRQEPEQNKGSSNGEMNNSHLQHISWNHAGPTSKLQVSLKLCAPRSLSSFSSTARGDAQFEPMDFNVKRNTNQHLLPQKGELFSFYRQKSSGNETGLGAEAAVRLEAPVH